MHRKLIIFLLLCSAARGAVTIPKWYDDRVCAVLWTGDDMASTVRTHPSQTNRWYGFLDAADFAIDKGLVFNPACLYSDDGSFLGMDAFGYAELQSRMNISEYLPGMHGWNHAVDMSASTIEAQFFTSTVNRVTNFDLLDQHSYKGIGHPASFVKWGGVTTPADWYGATYWGEGGSVRTLLASQNYLVVRHWSDTIGLGEPMVWNVAYGMYDDINPTDGVADVLAGDFSSFDYAYANSNFYMLYNHPWKPDELVYGVSNAAWEAWGDYHGGRLDVLYTDLDSMTMYEYLRTRAAPAITETNTATYYKMTVVGDGAERDKYGLSYPLTYKIDKPAEWGESTPYSVQYRDTGSWSSMTEKTTNDFFTGINCYRDETNVVYVSQGLPQNSDQFEIKLRRTDRGRIPAFFRTP
jgi:hypothetical protein